MGSQPRPVTTAVQLKHIGEIGEHMFESYVK
jgi:hypothetical protein